MKVKDLLKSVKDKCVSVDDKDTMLSYLSMEQDLISNNDFIIGWYEYKNKIHILFDDITGSDLQIQTGRYTYITNYDDAENINWYRGIHRINRNYTLPSIFMGKIVTILPKELEIDFRKVVDDYIKKSYEGMSYDDYVKSKQDKRQQSIDFIYDLLTNYNYKKKKDLSLMDYGEQCYDDDYVVNLLKETEAIYLTYKNIQYSLLIHKDYIGIINDDLFLFSIKVGFNVNDDLITIETLLKEQTVDGLIKTINELSAKEQAIVIRVD